MESLLAYHNITPWNGDSSPPTIEWGSIVIQYYKVTGIRLSASSGNERWSIQQCSPNRRRLHSQDQSIYHIDDYYIVDGINVYPCDDGLMVQGPTVTIRIPTMITTSDDSIRVVTGDICHVFNVYGYYLGNRSATDDDRWTSDHYNLHNEIYDETHISQEEWYELHGISR